MTSTANGNSTGLNISPERSVITIINLYGIHNLMKERFTAYAALLIYPPAVPSMHYEAVPIHITALTIDGAGEFLIDAVSTMGAYHPAIPIQRVCMSKHEAALYATRLNMEHRLVKNTICLYHGKKPFDPERIEQLVTPVPYSNQNLYELALDEDTLYGWCGLEKPDFPAEYQVMLITNQNQNLASHALHIVQTNLNDQSQVMFSLILSSAEETDLLDALVLFNRR